MGKGLLTIILLVVSNSFMTLAWYGHLKFGADKMLPKWGMFGIIAISWLIAFFEYCFQVPANRIGSDLHGGPFSLIQLKVIQEVISCVVFGVIFTFAFKGESLQWNHFAAVIFLALAVYFVFMK